MRRNEEVAIYQAGGVDRGVVAEEEIPSASREACWASFSHGTGWGLEETVWRWMQQVITGSEVEPIRLRF